MFESIHGSAPKYKDQNKANPIATIAAVQMMLTHLGEEDGARILDTALGNLLSGDGIKSMNAGVHGTDELGDMVVTEVNRLGS